MLQNIIEKTIEKVGKQIVLGAPLGIGKPHPLLNAFYHYAKSHSDISLTIYTALSLNPPSAGRGLQARFLQPFLERQFGSDYPALDYVTAIKKNQVPDNITIVEFYMQSGAMLGKLHAQQNYLSSNYTHIARDMLDAGVNVICQLVTKRVVADTAYYSLSGNPDVTLDLAESLTDRRDTVCVLGMTNSHLPYMAEDAEVSAAFFDHVIDSPEYDYQPFAIPRAPVNTVEHAIGIYASSLVQDGGTLQIGIGALGDAICHALCQRQQDNVDYQKLLDTLAIPKRYTQLLDVYGGAGLFNIGLYAASEMFMDGFLHLHTAGILKRKVYDDIGLQSVLNKLDLDEQPYGSTGLMQALASYGVIHHQLRESDIDWLKHWGLLHTDVKMHTGILSLKDYQTEATVTNDHDCAERLKPLLGNGLRYGKRLHAAFFLGSRWFYETLNQMSQAQRNEFMMTRVSRINQLYRGEALDRVQRHKARFINTCMKVTLLGAAISDQLNDGRVISGVGGQYNFVAMAHALDDSRSILMLRSTRNSNKGLESNIVWEYAHTTIPRHLRDIVITEYGIADLRGQTDNECIKRILCITDSRFQNELQQQAINAGKLSADWTIPDHYRANLPQQLQHLLEEHQLPRWPFGSDLTTTEQQLAKALKWLAAQPKWKLPLHLLKPGRDYQEYAEAMQRMGLQKDNTHTFKDKIQSRLLLSALHKTGPLN